MKTIFEYNRNLLKPLMVGLVFLNLGFLASIPVHAQRARAIEAAEVTELLVTLDSAIPVQDEEELDEDDDGDSGSGKYMGGASLKTDPDLAALLKKADEFRRDGNYQVASKYWQAVLERSGDTLYSDDGETYFAMTEKVESILAQLPDDGLRAYRISADASAREVLAQAKGDYDVETLSKIVRTYFISSLGDEAAYQLGGIFLDRYDFVAGVRLLRKITDQYPDPSVPLGDVWLKLAVAYTYLGDNEQAKQSLEKAMKLSSDVDNRVREEIAALVEAAPQLTDRAVSARDWTMRMGGPRRFGVMSSLPGEYLTTDLVARWQYYIQPALEYDDDNKDGNVLIGEDSYSDSVSKTVQAKEKDFIKKWRGGGWRPAAHLLMDGSNIVFKSGGDFTVWDREPTEEVKWRPLWINYYIEDDASRTLRNMISAYGGGNNRNRKQPNQPDQVLYYADLVQHSSSIYRGVLYNIEGEVYDPGDRPKAAKKGNAGYRWGQMPRRGRTNSLTAYDVETGKLRWQQPPVKELAKKKAKSENEDSEEVLDPFDSVGFMSAPVGVGDLILVPVSQTGSIFIYAMSFDTGELVWKSYLCDEPTGGSDPFSPMDITLEGSSAYISCGTGVLFAVDPLTGMIQFARRYERTGNDDPVLHNMGITGNMIVDGWKADMVLPYGNVLLLFSSDFNNVWAIDRQTAKFKWKTENRPFGSKFDYLIGIYNDKIYLGGTESIAAISISAEGRWEWVEEFDDEKSLGRAALTPNGIYVPIEDSIAHFKLEGKDGRGDLVNRVGVRLGTGAPVGNLFSDGEKLWVVGANRLYVLGPAPPAVENEEDDSKSDEEDDTDEESDDESSTSDENKRD